MHFREAGKILIIFQQKNEKYLKLESVLKKKVSSPVSTMFHHLNIVNKFWIR